MEFFELRPAWNARGDSEYHLIDSADGLFDVDSLHKTAPIARSWNPAVLVLAARRRMADVYFCPGDCYFFSAHARGVVEPLFGTDAEWLPVAIQGLGTHYALHPLRQARLATRSQYRVSEVSGNIVEIMKPVFDLDSAGTIFYASQAAGSAAEQAGFCVPSIFITAQVRAAISANLSGLHLVAHASD